MTSPAYTIGQTILRRGGRMVLDRQATLRIEGREYIPTGGPVVLVARHYHHLLDGCALYQATPRPVHILVGLDWAGTGLRQRLMETLCRTARWPVILRPDALKSEGEVQKQAARRRLREASREVVELLSNGKVVVVFPEGYPVVDPHAQHPRPNPEGLMPFQPGVVSLVRMAERAIGDTVPLIPVGFDYRQMSDDRWNITMRIGEAITMDEDAGVLERLESRVAVLSGLAGSASH